MAPAFFNDALDDHFITPYLMIYFYIWDILPHIIYFSTKYGVIDCFSLSMIPRVSRLSRGRTMPFY